MGEYVGPALKCVAQRTHNILCSSCHKVLVTRDKTMSQYWFNFGPTSTTVAQHLSNTGWNVSCVIDPSHMPGAVSLLIISDRPRCYSAGLWSDLRGVPNGGPSALWSIRIHTWGELFVGGRLSTDCDSDWLTIMARQALSCCLPRRRAVIHRSSHRRVLSPVVDTGDT